MGTLAHFRFDDGQGTTSRLLIGATGHATDERWTGWIDQVRITDEALEPAQFIPEPGTLSLLGLAGLTLLARRRRARR